MKYIYKKTGTIVESDGKLDSILFEPVTEHVDTKSDSAEKKKAGKKRRK